MEFGEPISTTEFDNSAAADPAVISTLTEQVREAIRQSLGRLQTRREHAFSR